MAVIVLAVLAGGYQIAHVWPPGSRSPSTPAGSAAPPASAGAAATTARLGQTLTVIDADGSRAAVTVLSLTHHARGRGPLARRPQNGQYAVADIAVRVQSGAYTYGAPYFALQAAGGSVYSWSDGNGAIAGFEPEMRFGTLHAGQSTRGLVAFDVPPGAGRDIQLSGVDGSVLGEWALR